MAQPTTSEGALESVKVSLDSVKVKVPTKIKSDKLKYWVGTLPECPYQNVHIAGVAFPRYIDPPIPSQDEAGETLRNRMNGAEVWLDLAQVDKIKAKSVKMILRPAGNRAFLLNSDDASYVPQPADEPIAKFVYMVKIAEQMPASWRAGFGPAMAS